jgi:thiamine pyrophosphate-dependent acetolactate synthase large subunit-like protein
VITDELARLAGTRPIREVPVGVTGDAGSPEWGSDVVADVLRALEIEYVSLVPGASFRGLHDSLVNYTGNREPELVLCTHENDAVFLARGYARVTGRPMAVALHDHVGLLNATMAINDCWIDRVPVLVLGGTGPMDAAKRRPLIDWLHTANIQGTIVRDYTKWDDQPASVDAIPESLLRGYKLACQDPPGPVYVCFDWTLQEQPLAGEVPLPDVSRYRPAKPPSPGPEDVLRIAEAIVSAELPLAFVDRVGRDAGAAGALVELAELVALPVVDQAWHRISFPSRHPLSFSGDETALLAEADVVIALDCRDLGSTLSGGAERARVVNVGSGELLHRGLVTDYGPLPAADIPVLASATSTLPVLLAACRELLDDAARDRIERRRRALASRQAALRSRQQAVVAAEWGKSEISESRLAAELWHTVEDRDFVLAAGGVHLSAPGVWDLTPDRSVAGPGSGAVGSSLPSAIGSALALKRSGKLPLALLGDGDFLMSCSALSTAARYRIPLLVVVNNNRSYGNDELHQERIATVRGRPVENARIAMRIDDPAPDLAAVARSFGATGIGPVTGSAALATALREGAELAACGACVVVDVWTALQRPAH